VRTGRVWSTQAAQALKDDGVEIFAFGFGGARR
jgi:hypothetical protein